MRLGLNSLTRLSGCLVLFVCLLVCVFSCLCRSVYVFMYVHAFVCPCDRLPFLFLSVCECMHVCLYPSVSQSVNVHLILHLNLCVYFAIKPMLPIDSYSCVLSIIPFC